MFLRRGPLNDAVMFSRVCFVVAAILNVVCDVRNEFFRNSIPSECRRRPESLLRRRAFLLTYLRSSWCNVFSRTALRNRGCSNVTAHLTTRSFEKKNKKKYETAERVDVAHVRRPPGTLQQNSRAFCICKQFPSQVWVRICSE